MKSTFFFSCILLAASSIARVGRVCYDCKGQVVQSCADACFPTSIRGSFTGFSTIKVAADMLPMSQSANKPIKLSKRGKPRRG